MTRSPCCKPHRCAGAPEIEALVGAAEDPEEANALLAINSLRSEQGLGLLDFCPFSGDVDVATTTLPDADAWPVVPHIGLDGAAEMVDPELRPHAEVCMGGTYDRLHVGHKLLLSHAALVTSDRLFCGIMGPESLQKKSLKEVMESMPTRRAVVHNFLESIKPTIKYEVEHIPNPYGPSITDPSFNAIVVSEETRSGGEACNKKRGAAGMPPMAVVGVDVVEGDADDVVATGGKETKVSSSGQRKKTLGKFAGSAEGWYRKTNAADLPYCIGITGGIASGKSSAAKFLKARGAHVIDCDHLGWASYRVGGPAYAGVVAAFGDSILNPDDGEVDRKKLGPVVFGTPGNLEKLNGIVWPVIRDMAVAEMKRLKAEKGVEVCAMEAAVLFEAGWESVTDEIWTVFCSRPEAKRRLMERNALSEEDAEKRIAAQLTNEERLQKSNVLICSEWDAEQTQEQLAEAWAGAQARSANGLLAAAEAGSLAHRWNAALVELGLDKDAALCQSWWRRIRDAYTDPYRHYHTLDHLRKMFAHFDAHRAALKVPALVTMAIFFHDVVYAEENVGKHPKNEMESAELWRKFASEVGFAEDQAGDVASWIERTAAHHGDPKAGAVRTEGDLAYFLDFDLSIMGASPAAYAEYAQQVRLEYASVPMAQFREGRGKFMPQFLTAESLYFTEPFKAKYEVQARRNVENEVKRLLGEGGVVLSNL